MLPLVLIVVGGMLGSGAISWFMAQRARPAAVAAASEGEKTKAENVTASNTPAEYLDLGPPFIIALADEGKSRYLQVQMQLLAHDNQALAMVEKSMPTIRNNLLLRLGQERTDTLRTREDKERVQAAVLEEVNGVLHAADEKLKIDAVLFTSFVTQ
jgi:flagellar FliL protein